MDAALPTGAAAVPFGVAALVIVAIAVLVWLGLARWRWNIVWIVLGMGLAGALTRAAGLAM